MCDDHYKMTILDLAEFPNAPENLVAELRQLISEARRHATATVSDGLITSSSGDLGPQYFLGCAVVR
jgi:hypothetical protein